MYQVGLRALWLRRVVDGFGCADKSGSSSCEKVDLMPMEARSGRMVIGCWCGEALCGESLSTYDRDPASSPTSGPFCSRRTLCSKISLTL